MIYNAIDHGRGIFTLIYSDEKGVITKKKCDFRPSYFIPTDNKNSSYKTLRGEEPLRKVSFTSSEDYRYNLNRQRRSAEGDIAPKLQFIIEQAKKNPELNKFNAEHIKATNYDIEVFDLKETDFPDPEYAKYEIKSIVLQDMKSNKFLVMTIRKEYEITDVYSNGKLVVKKENIIHRDYANERLLLMEFVRYIKNKVYVLTGWNTLNFDNRYIINRCKRLNIEMDYIMKAREMSDGMHFDGILNLDYMELVKKFDLKVHPNYRLDSIAKTYLGYKKLELKGGFRGAFVNDFKNFIDYNIVDVGLVSDINKKKKFLDLCFNLANMFYCTPTDTMFVTRYIDSAIYNMALERGLIVPGKRSTPPEKYIGGFVEDPIRGITRWGFICDITSSYPNQSRQSNISYETIVHYDDLPADLKEKTYSLKMAAAKKAYMKYRMWYDTKNDTKPAKSYAALAGKNRSVHTELTNEHMFPKFAICYCGDTKITKRFEYVSKVDEFTYIVFVQSRAEFKRLNKFVESNRPYLNSFGLPFIMNDDEPMVHGFNESFIASALTEYYNEDHTRFKTFTDLLTKYNYTMCPNLQFFSKHKFGIIAEFQETTFFERKKWKRRGQYYGHAIDIFKKVMADGFKFDDDILDKHGLVNIKDDIVKGDLLRLLSENNVDGHNILGRSQADCKINDGTLKIVINATYGFLADPRGRYYNRHMAEAITSSGQLACTGVGEYLKKELPLIKCYQDTDSLIMDIIEKTLGEIFEGKNTLEEKTFAISDWFESTVLPKIKQVYLETKEYRNSRDVDINMELEAIMSKKLFTDKKKYCWRTVLVDGVFIGDDEPTYKKYKSKGLSYIKSNTPPLVKKMQETFTHKVLETEDEKYCRGLIHYCKSKFKDADPEKIATPTKCNNIHEYEHATEKIPAHVQAGLNYNRWLDKNKIRSHEKIKSGDKIRWLYVSDDEIESMALPMEYHPKVLSDININRDKQFEATFMGLINRIFDVCDWDIEEQVYSF